MTTLPHLPPSPSSRRVSRRGFLAASAIAVPAAWAVGTSGVANAASARHAAATPAVGLAWHDITNQTVNAAKFAEPVTQSRTWAVSWLAAARALRGNNDADYAVAAFAQALHDTLAAQVPSQQASLDASLAATLASITDGPAKKSGIAAGAHEASVILAERAGDGLDTASVDLPWTPPPPAPGIFQLTPPVSRLAVRAGEGKARPFLLKRNDQFDPGPPPGLDSPTYHKALAEVEYIGATDSPRTAEQTEVANFLQNPTWTSFWVAPQHPEYPSGHGGQIGSQQAVLDAFLGPRAPAPIQLTSPDALGVTRTYSDWKTITDDVINARVWEGVHLRTSDVKGVDQGLRLARWELGRLAEIGLQNSLP